MAEDQLVSGKLFFIAMDFLKVHKGEAALSQLEKIHGSITFGPHQMYPLSELEKNDLRSS